MLVSIIIPTYNDSQKNLSQSIDSVLKQTHNTLELIVVDDGSLRPFAGIRNHYSDSRLIWILINKNLGVANARNKGIKECKGEFIAFLDTGDWWERNKLELQLNYFKDLDESYGLVYCSYISRFSNGTQSIVRSKYRGDISKIIYEYQCITGSCSSVLIKKICINDIGGFYEDEDIPEDWDLWARIASKYKVDYVDDVLVNIKVEPFSRSFDPEEKEITYKRFIKLHEKTIHQLGMKKKALSVYHRYIARKYADTGNFKKMIVHTIYSFYYSQNFKAFKAIIAFNFKMAKCLANQKITLKIGFCLNL